eukprot:3303025-Rhodomonas_salina.1
MQTQREAERQRRRGRGEGRARGGRPAGPTARQALQHLPHPLLLLPLSPPPLSIPPRAAGARLQR